MHLHKPITIRAYHHHTKSSLLLWMQTLFQCRSCWKMGTWLYQYFILYDKLDLFVSLLANGSIILIRAGESWMRWVWLPLSIWWEQVLTEIHQTVLIPLWTIFYNPRVMLIPRQTRIYTLGTYCWAKLAGKESGILQETSGGMRDQTGSRLVWRQICRD